MPEKKSFSGTARQGWEGEQTWTEVAHPRLRAAHPRLGLKRRPLRLEAVTGTGKKILCPTIEVIECLFFNFFSHSSVATVGRSHYVSTSERNFVQACFFQRALEVRS